MRVGGFVLSPVPCHVSRVTLECRAERICVLDLDTIVALHFTLYLHWLYTFRHFWILYTFVASVFVTVKNDWIVDGCKYQCKTLYCLWYIRSWHGRWVLPVIRSPLFSPEYPAAFFRDFLPPQSPLWSLLIILLRSQHSTEQHSQQCFGFKSHSSVISGIWWRGYFSGFRVNQKSIVFNKKIKRLSSSPLC